VYEYTVFVSVSDIGVIIRVTLPIIGVRVKFQIIRIIGVIIGAE